MSKSDGKIGTTSQSCILVSKKVLSQATHRCIAIPRFLCVNLVDCGSCIEIVHSEIMQSSIINSKKLEWENLQCCFLLTTHGR